MESTDELTFHVHLTWRRGPMAMVKVVVCFAFFFQQQVGPIYRAVIFLSDFGALILPKTVPGVDR